MSETPEKSIAAESNFGFLKRRLFNKENLWALALSVMLFFMLVFIAASAQPRFVYAGF
jgi:hypothetical protein